MKNLLSIQECTALKGISILFIILHNLFRQVTPFQDNEKFFNADLTAYYLDHCYEAPIMSFFGYFCWIGVAVFVFLTGYGLSLKYGDSWDTKNKYLSSKVIIGGVNC